MKTATANRAASAAGRPASRAAWVQGLRQVATWRNLLVFGLAALVVHHAFLFRDRLVDSSIFDPAVAWRWVASALLVAAIAFLRRRGIDLFRPRHLGILAVLVLLLHCGMVAPPDHPALAIPSGLLLVVPVGFVLLAVVELLFGLYSGGFRLPTFLRRHPPAIGDHALLLVRGAFLWAARPPPALYAI